MSNITKPTAGIDYPSDLQEFDNWFSDEAACRHYLSKLRWSDGYRCLQCGSQRTPWTTSRGYLHCCQCGSEISVTSGTIFERTRMPLRLWFQAMWLLTSQKYGVSALGLQRALGLHSYQTAWTWLHKLRRAMVRHGRDRLSGSIEVDETYVGGVVTGGKRGRGAQNKAIVVIGVEVFEPNGFGRIRMRRISDVSSQSLVPFICDLVEPGSEISTDGWLAYGRIPADKYTHKRTVLSNSGDPAHVAMPAVHRIASLLKRWLLGIHQGAVSGKHLDYYLDEYTFRFNRRTSRSRGMLFYRLMQQAVLTPSVPYRKLVE